MVPTSAGSNAFINAVQAVHSVLKGLIILYIYFVTDKTVIVGINQDDLLHYKTQLCATENFLDFVDSLFSICYLTVTSGY
jgi:hypothetical protein